MVILGITGGSGTGKTTVSSVFGEYGAYIIDADKVARAVTEPGQPALREIADAFGAEVINADGTLARRKLGDIVFSDDDKLKQLNAITHPHIAAHIRRLLDAYQGEIALIDGAVLIESGIDKTCDYLCVVLADRQTRAARIIERDGLTPEQAYARIEAQQSDLFYRQHADFVIQNDGDMDYLRAQTAEIMREVTQKRL